ncbi:DUF2750 domain-containing protein [Pelistega sp. NLN82]|uniref:DUF2750 domain-containing protein n=1 Tax=Pelistega ratti TaxID=2652177 RepID=A0A6L9Y4S7_9BURK|nr:DUF2750 domain-containing protein [Pelistega ratti]NEN75470.1 DUF2750 domain-containing protein [Pelistega ratti]
MNIKEIENVLSLPKEKLYKTFLLRVADYNQIWVLDDDGILLYGDNEGRRIFPIWPEKEFANLCATDDWIGAKALSIDLEEFLTDYIPEIIDNNDLLSIFPRNNDKQSIVLEPKEFASHIVNYILEEYGEEIELIYL